MTNCSIWPIDRILSRATIQVRVIAIKGYPTFPKYQRLEPHHQMVYCCIQDNPWWRILPLCRDVACVFYSPSRLSRKAWGLFNANLLIKRHESAVYDRCVVGLRLHPVFRFYVLVLIQSIYLVSWLSSGDICWNYNPLTLKSSL